MTTAYEGKEETYDAFLMDGHYYTNSRQFIASEYISEVRHNPNPDWQERMHPGVDYNRNIFTPQVD